MKHRNLLLILMVCLIGALWFAPVVGYAAEGDHAAETEHDSEHIEEISPRGPGAVILMIGLAAIGVVGLVYSTQQTTDAKP